MKKLMACLAFAVLSVAAAPPPPPLNLQTDVPMGGAAQTVIVTEHDLKKGESTGLHIHHGVEMTYVKHGTVRLSILGQAPVDVPTGGSFKVEREMPHDALNTGDGTAELIITYVVDKGRPLKEPYAPPPGAK